MRTLFTLFLTLFISLFISRLSLAEQTFNAGFRTHGVWLQDDALRLDLNIWYPSHNKTRDCNFIPWTLHVALNGKAAEGTFPLIVLSHASPGTRFSYHYLASFLAENGYIIAAPTHPTDSLENMDDLFTWAQLEKRIKEIRASLEILLEDQELGSHIDRNSIGFLGFGTGASAGLLLAGAMPSCEAWPDYCSHAPAFDPYCTNWGREKINILCKNLPEKSLKDAQFRAFAIIAPAYGMLFNASSFPSNFPPLLLVGAGKDQFNHFEMHSERLARILGKKANYLHLARADAGALMNACPPSYETELPELCKSVTDMERKQLHQTLEKAISKFFSMQLKQ